MNKVKIKNDKYELKYDYYVTDTGQIYSDKTNKFLSQHLDKDGYCKVRLVCKDSRHTFSVHRLVLENFNPIINMSKMQVNHIDGDKTNNNLLNLEWNSSSQNNKHAYDIGLKTQKGERNNASKLTEKEVIEIIDMLLEKKYTYREIGVKYNVGEDCIGAIKRKYNWKDLTKNINFN